MTLLSDKVSSFFISKGIIKDGDKAVYTYCFEVLISFVLNFIIIFFLALFTKTFHYALLFIAAFLPLRIIGGGYHADSHFRCILTMVIIYLIFVLLINLFPSHLIKYTSFGVLCFSLKTVFLLAPSEVSNNTLNPHKKSRLKCSSRIISIIYTIGSVCGLLLLKNLAYAFSFVLGFFTVAVSLLVNKLKTIFTDNRSILKGFNIP